MDGHSCVGGGPRLFVSLVLPVASHAIASCGVITADLSLRPSMSATACELTAFKRLSVDFAWLVWTCCVRRRKRIVWAAFLLCGRLPDCLIMIGWIEQSCLGRTLM